MDLTQLSCEDFLSQLASKAPAPGGGGAAALVGAAGVALGNMVGNLTTGKKKYSAVEEEILALNVAINTKLMTDRAHAAALDEKAARMLAEYLPLADEVYQSVANRLRA